MKKKIVVNNGSVVFSEGVIETDIMINNGVIEKIEKGIEIEPDYTVIDAKHKYVLPGIIDAHVHPQYVDGFESLSECAAYGGITTLIHYVYAKKGDDFIEKVEDAIEEGNSVSYLDFALHVSLQDVENQIIHIKEAVDRGITSFKMFMPFGQRGMSVSDSLLIGAMDEIGKCGGISMVHAESSACEYLEKKLVEANCTSPKYYPRSRPNILEAEAVSRAIILADAVGCPIYMVHLSAMESLAVVNEARYNGKAVYTETCPHYLALTEDIFEKLGPLAKCAPPIRSSKDVDAMWKALKNQLIDVVASDHAGYTKAKKQFENVFETPFGIPGSETMLRLIHEEGINKGRIDYPKFVKLLSENPAKIFGLYPKKGTLQVGSDADIVIIDPQQSVTIEEDNLHGNSDFTLYDGWRCNGDPVLTMQKGKIVLNNGKLCSQPGDGNFMKSTKFDNPIL
jgi:dihydropyrimidinase